MAKFKRTNGHGQREPPGLASPLFVEPVEVVKVGVVSPCIAVIQRVSQAL